MSTSELLNMFTGNTIIMMTAVFFK